MAERAMPSFKGSPPELIERFATVLDRYPDAQRRQMFGYPAAFVGGNHATGLFHDRWVIRLPEADAAAARMAGADAFEPIPGRAMKGYVLVPAADVADDAKIATWVERGLATAAAMPAKK